MLTSSKAPGYMQITGSNLTQDQALYTRNIEYYGYNTAHLNGFKSALATNSLTSVQSILWIGDSISEGANSTAYLTDGYVGIIRDVLQSKYGNAGSGLYTSWRRTSAAGLLYTEGGTGAWSDGGYGRQGTFGATDSVTFSGTGATVLYLKGSGAGNFTYEIDGGAPVTVNANNGTTIKASFDITGLTDGSHTIVFTSNQSGKTLFLYGIIPIKGTTGIRVDNAAWYGHRIDMLSSTTVRDLAFSGSPVATFIAMTANDYLNQTNLKLYKSYFSDIIDRALLTGKVILINNGLRDLSPTIPQIDQNWYSNALYELADSKNVALIDINAKWGTAESAVTAGLIDTDKVHWTNLGHRDAANEILKIILN